MLGIVVLFVFGVFWKLVMVNGVLVVVIGFFGFLVFGKFYLDWMFFFDCVGWIFLVCLGIMFVMVMIECKD